MKKYSILFFFISLLGFSQTTYLMNNNTAVNLTCPSTSLFYDSGNSGGNYANNENYTKTFNVPAGYCIMVQFGNGFNTESCCDRLRIFDGPNGASPSFGLFYGTVAPFVPTTYVSSGTSMTFSWTSDGSIVAAGWQATITCLSACSGTPAPGFSSLSSGFCAGSGTVNLTNTGYSTGCGITYFWQQAPSATGPWTNIAGAITPNASTTFTSTTYYRMRSQCNAANTVYSNTIVATATSYTTPCSLSTYVASGTTYNFEALVGTNAPQTDDILFNNTVNLGFNFCFGGAQYNTCYIASNGAIVFDAVPCYPNIGFGTNAAPGIGTGWSITAAAPVNNTSIPRNAILGPWQDIDPSLGGLIEYATVGTAPNRRFIVSYDQIPMFSCGVAAGAGQFFSGQIKIFETTGNIEVHIRNKQLCTTWNGGYAVMGLHNYDGTIYRPPTASMVNHNYPTQWTMTNTGYQWTSTCANCNLLPIEFKQFYGERIERVNKLYWETAMEENIKYFSVERSDDAENFKEIAKVDAKNLPSLYNYNDHDTKPGSMYYYRITSVEKNGERKHTNVIPLGSNLNEVLVSGIYPNPVEDDFVMSVDARSSTDLQVRIYDVVGKMVKEFKPTPSIGTQHLRFSVPELPAGSYMLEVRSSDDQIITQHKLVKVD